MNSNETMIQSSQHRSLKCIEHKTCVCISSLDRTSIAWLATENAAEMDAAINRIEAWHREIATGELMSMFPHTPSKAPIITSNTADDYLQPFLPFMEAEKK